MVWEAVAHTRVAVQAVGINNQVQVIHQLRGGTEIIGLVIPHQGHFEGSPTGRHTKLEAGSPSRHGYPVQHLHSAKHCLVDNLSVVQQLLCVAVMCNRVRLDSSSKHWCPVENLDNAKQCVIDIVVAYEVRQCISDIICMMNAATNRQVNPRAYKGVGNLAAPALWTAFWQLHQA